MKKIIAIAVVGLVSLASCKGNYTCECKTGGDNAIVTTSEIKNKTLSEANTACESKSGSALGITKTCKIKLVK